MQAEILAFLQNPIKSEKYLIKYDEFILPDFVSKIREIFADFEEYRYYPKSLQDLQAMCAEILSIGMFSEKKVCYIYFDDYTELIRGFIEKLIKISDKNIIIILIHTKDNAKLAGVSNILRILPLDLEKNFSKWAICKINISGISFTKEGTEYLLAELETIVDVIQCLEKLKLENLSGTKENLKIILENMDISYFAKKLINILVKSDSQIGKKDEIILELKRQNLSISTLIWYFLNELKRNSYLYPDYIEKMERLYDLNLESRIYDEDYIFLKLRILVASIR